MNRLALPLLLAGLAAGCTPEASAPAEQGGKAAGEVLGGSISDAMIPLEQLESEAPPAPREAPQATDIDSEQPEVAPLPGINDPAPVEGAEPAAAAPAPAATE